MPTITAKELNQQYGHFWADQTRLLQRRMADDTVRNVAFGLIHDQELVGMPMRQRLTLEKALEAAEKMGRRFSAAWSHKGGKARKTDPLRSLIEWLVEHSPSITVGGLERHLREHQGIDPIVEIDGDLISIALPDGRLKDVKLKGLKHRLSRAKKKFKTR